MQSILRSGQLSRNLCFTDLRLGIQVSCLAVSEVGLEPDLLENCVLMVGELAGQQAVAEAGGGGNRLGSASADVEGEPTMFAGPAPPDFPTPAPADRGQRPMARATRW
jgi:hypothetical protein